MSFIFYLHVHDFNTFMFKELLNNVDQVTCVKAVMQKALNGKFN